jgi:disulfide bond formation protein DsbB
MNPDTLHYLNLFLGLGAILLQVVSVVVLLMLVFGARNSFLDFIKRNFLSLSFVVVLLATLFSLFYSEVINFVPCYLCWYQRIFMFPLVFLYGIALRHKDKTIERYTFPIIITGMLFALYQNFFYYFSENSLLPCDASGVSCYQRLISEFGGYISFPMLSLTIFFTVFVLVLINRFYKSEII